MLTMSAPGAGIRGQNTTTRAAIISNGFQRSHTAIRKANCVLAAASWHEAA